MLLTNQISHYLIRLRLRTMPVVKLMLGVALAVIVTEDGAASSPDTPSEEPATLGSMDEQYAWVGDLGDRDALPGKPLYMSTAPAVTRRRSTKRPTLPGLSHATAGAVSVHHRGDHANPGRASLNEDKQHIVEYITQMRLGGPNAARMWPGVGPATEFSGLEEDQLTGWGHDTRRFVSSDIAGFDRSQIGDLELQWSFGFPASTRARSRPRRHGRRIRGRQDEIVYAFDLEPGCGAGPCRASRSCTGITLGKRGPEGIPIAYFGDIIANLYALDATTGELVWQPAPMSTVLP